MTPVMVPRAQQHSPASTHGSPWRGTARRSSSVGARHAHGAPGMQQQHRRAIRASPARDSRRTVVQRHGGRRDGTHGPTARSEQPALAVSTSAAPP